MKRLKSIILTFLTVILSGIGVTVSENTVYAATTQTQQTVYEAQNIMDDLKGSTINGKPFSLSDYPYNADGVPQVISFIEFCYAATAEKQSDYGLYIYVYNPARTEFKLTSENNCIEVRTGGDTSANFSKDYKLKYLNSGENGLFLKFKLDLTSAQKYGMLQRVQSSERVYEVSSFELMCGNKITDYPIKKTYRYSGYAKGYAPDSVQDNTLSCKSDGLVTLSLDAHSTAYRPDGSNGKNVYTQDSLHSVYFAIPNEYLQKYGEMSQVHAKWLNATLKPGLVTGNKEMYEKLLPIAAHNIPMSSISNYESYGLDWKYAYLGGVDNVLIPGAGVFPYYGYSLFGNETKKYSDARKSDKIYGEELAELPILLYAINGNADKSKFESTEELLNYVKNYPNVCSPELDPLQGQLISGADKPIELVAGKYPSTLFSKYDTKYTEVKVAASEEIELKEYKVDQNWWGKLLGGGLGWEQTEQPFSSFQAIQAVKSADLIGSEGEICKRLAVGKADLPEFKEFYENNKSNSTVFLFRYYVSDFIAQEATLYKLDIVFPNKKTIVKQDTNAYFFQTDANLNFDIIDVSFDDGEIVTTIPVIMSPIDVIPNPTPPLITTPDFEFWKYGVGIICALSGVLIVAIIIDKGTKKV